MTNPNFQNRCKHFVQQMVADKNLLITYLRDERGNPRSTVVAVRTGDQVAYGHTLCRTDKDHFNKYVGTYIAVQRALSGRDYPHNDRHDAAWQATEMLKARAAKYWRLYAVA